MSGYCVQEVASVFLNMCLMEHLHLNILDSYKCKILGPSAHLPIPNLQRQGFIPFKTTFIFFI